jgi:methyl coenzyme M reductase subunit C-like uncharacterized protein (methanogenesis marker protein 7)
MSRYLYELRKVYPSIVKTIGDVAYDEQNNVVEYDPALVQAEMDKTAYIAKRIAEYPPITDYLDGVVKGDQVQIQAYIDTCLAVKTKYPKGE